MREIPTVHSELRTNSSKVGQITIKSDGTFIGEFTDRLTHSLWVEYMKSGLASSMTLHPNAIPALPSRTMCQMGNNSHQKTALVQVQQRNGTTDLCKTCLDSWLDNADQDENLEPIGIRFLDERTT